MTTVTRQRKGGQTSNPPDRHNGIKHGQQTDGESRQRKLFGFAFTELTSWQSFVRLLCRPTDPAGLGILRFLYGILLMIDTLEERGLGRHVFKRWSADKCQSPVFSFLKPMSLEIMYVLCFTMLLATIGIALGFMYRWSLVIFNAIYWYTFALDKTVWNNHSYMFGLLAFLLLLMDGNRYWSIDSIIWPRLRNQEVPLWNYTLLRFQVFILYFLAGIKKLDAEWLYAYSERGLAAHWTFDIFRPFLTNYQIDLYVVHRFGCVLDLTLGFLVFFDKTRPMALLMGISFHVMNSQIFSIGMFPYMGIATLSVFCYPNWPRKIVNRILFWSTPTGLVHNPHCLYTKDDIKPKVKQVTNGTRASGHPETSSEETHRRLKASSKPSTYHVVCAVFVLLYIAEQLVLPFSFGVFKGIATWTGGTYGFSWNMMIHKPNVNVQIFLRDLESGEKIDITGWMKKLSARTRWSYNPVSLLQYTQCLAKKVETGGKFAINYDIWMSLNKRIHQRLYDPNKNMLTAEWSLFSKTDWFLPEIPGYWEMREKKMEIMKAKNRSTILNLMSDFPGFHFETRIINDTTTCNTTLTILRGTVIVEDVIKQTNISLEAGHSIRMPPSDKYRIHTVSQTPSYVMFSKQHVSNVSMVDQYMAAVEAKKNGQDPEGKLLLDFDKKDIYALKAAVADSIQNTESKRTFGPDWSVGGFISFLNYKYFLFKNGIKMSMGAMGSIVYGYSFEDFIAKYRI